MSDSRDRDGGDARRGLPSVERVAARLEGLPRELLVDYARSAISDARDSIAAGAPISEEAVIDDARARAQHRAATLLRPIVNATGVLLHTNLGRAPLGADARDAAARVAAGYSNLEYEMERGVRGSRHDHAGNLLARAVSAESGLVVNNNAAAVLLVLAALARGRDVVVSRGELVEIGGGFRVPEIMSESGCRLVEVGTTNRTRRRDYEAAIGPEVALVLKVHASNYRMVGFTESTPLSELATLGPPVMLDAGSGLLDATTPWLGHRPDWLRDEPGVRQAIAAGAAITTFSGDKLLGGPQAGVIVGRAALVDAVARHPLARATRADKMTLAALQSVAWHYLDGRAAELPVWRMAATTSDALRARAEVLAARLPVLKVVDTDAVAGGGSVPGLVIPSVGVALEPRSVDGALARLRALDVVGRADAGRIVCDLRSVEPSDDVRLLDALRAAAGP